MMPLHPLPPAMRMDAPGPPNNQLEAARPLPSVSHKNPTTEDHVTSHTTHEQLAAAFQEIRDLIARGHKLLDRIQRERSICCDCHQVKPLEQWLGAGPAEICADCAAERRVTLDAWFNEAWKVMRACKVCSRTPEEAERDYLRYRIHCATCCPDDLAHDRAVEHEMLIADQHENEFEAGSRCDDSCGHCGRCS